MNSYSEPLKLFHLILSASSSVPDLNLIDLGYPMWSDDPQTVQGMQPLVLVRLANHAAAINLNNQPEFLNNGIHASHLTTNTS